MPKYREIIDQRLLAGGLVLLTTVAAHSQQKTSREIDGLIGPVHKVVTVHTTFARTADKWVEDREANTSVRTYDEKETTVDFGMAAQKQPLVAVAARSNTMTGDR